MKIPGPGIARELHRQPGSALLRPFAHTCGARGIGALEFSQTVLQSKSVQLIDGENADTALRTSWPAHEPMPTATGCVGESRIDDLHEPAVFRREGAHSLRIKQEAVP